MAKPFYSMDEVCARLGKNAEGVRTLVREGKLREFRDGGKVFFKSEDVDKLGGGPGRSKADSGEILLDAADDMAPSVKDPGASDSITLEPIGDDEDSKRKKEGTVITASGISVFDDDELEIDADPMAKTRISGAVGDEVPIESGSGSGSGLLDLTREADDTSLGAELLDEIYPGEDEVAHTRPSAAREHEEEPVVADEAEAAIDEPSGGEMVIPVYDASHDPSESIFAGVLVGALIVMAVAASVVGGVLQGYVPSYGILLSEKFAFFLIGAVLVVGLSTLLGWVIGKAGSPRRSS